MITTATGMHLYFTFSYWCFPKQKIEKNCSKNCSNCNDQLKYYEQALSFFENISHVYIGMHSN